MRSTAGYSLLEMLVATLLALVLLAGVMGALRAVDVMSATQPEAGDLYQRLRVAADALARPLASAGAPSLAGNLSPRLVDVLPAVFPYRIGARNADLPGSYDASRLSVVRAAPGARPGAIREAIGASPVTVNIDWLPGCGLADEVCGLHAGAGALVFDTGRRFNFFTIAAVAGSSVTLELRDPALAAVYPPGSRIIEVDVDSFLLKNDPAAGAYQLMHYDGYKTEQPVTDDVVELSCELFGDPQPPRLVTASGVPGTARATYGPLPPAPLVDDPADPWPAGENCVFAVQDGQQVSRLAALGPPAGGLVPLGPAALSDGPWCPHELAPNRFDADLLRIRRLRLHLRVQVSAPWLRGVSSLLFARPGTSRGGGLAVPDQRLVLEIAPRNLNAGR